MHNLDDNNEQPNFVWCYSQSACMHRLVWSGPHHREPRTDQYGVTRHALIDDETGSEVDQITSHDFVIYPGVNQIPLEAAIKGGLESACELWPAVRILDPLSTENFYAKTLIEGSCHSPSLRAWAELESRPAVVEAIEKRLAFLTERRAGLKWGLLKLPKEATE